MIRIVLVGLGKITHDQHLPTIRSSPDFELVAGVAPEGQAEGVPCFRSLDELWTSGIAFDAAAMCQPPQHRFTAAYAMLDAGKHVLLEKPPGATLSEVAILRDRAEAAGATLFAAWHSRFAAGVSAAKAWLAERAVRNVRIDWLEDVRHWHPGQAWIWQAGGMGVFDPGINALSIASYILPPFFLDRGTIQFPANRAAPIASELLFRDAAGAEIHARFDWRQTGPQTWTIAVETDDGTLELRDGGARLAIDGVDLTGLDGAEYPALYARFAELIRTGRHDVDTAPLRHVADAFTRADRQTTEAFHD
jgi:D-galactose 1-dehydrogenase